MLANTLDPPPPSPIHDPHRRTLTYARTHTRAHTHTPPPLLLRTSIIPFDRLIIYLTCISTFDAPMRKTWGGGRGGGGGGGGVVSFCSRFLCCFLLCCGTEVEWLYGMRKAGTESVFHCSRYFCLNCFSRLSPPPHPPPPHPPAHRNEYFCTHLLVLVV